MKRETIHMEVPNDPEAVSIVRLTASGIATKMGFSSEEIDQIKIAISEACNRVVRDTRSKEIDITFDIHKKKLVFNINHFHPNGKHHHLKDEVKMSKIFMKTFMDKVEITDKITMMKILH